MADRSAYVKTGNGGISRLANKLSLIPFVGGWLAVGFGTLGTVLDAGKWLFKGDIGSAATELVTGTVGHAINAIDPISKLMPIPFMPFSIGSLTWWGGKAGSALFTGHTLGTHGRAVAENIIGGVTGALGMKPKVLQSYPAGIGSLPGAASYYSQQGPGYWATRTAQQQGLDPNARYQQYARGDGREHVEALRNAAAMGQQQRSV